MTNTQRIYRRVRHLTRAQLLARIEQDCSADIARAELARRAAVERMLARLVGA